MASLYAGNASLVNASEGYFTKLEDTGEPFVIFYVDFSSIGGDTTSYQICAKESGTATYGISILGKKLGYPEVPEEWNLVKTTKQSLTDEQKAQARVNIGAGQPIIDVLALPESNIQESALYRLLTGALVVNQVAQNGYTCYCVEELPEVGEPATNADNTQGTVYYNVQDGSLNGYVDSTLAAAMSIAEGWYPAETLLQALGYEYNGVITDVMDDPRDDKFRLLLEYVLYSYKGGEWNELKIIGKKGEGNISEVFNHPSNKASGEASHAEGYLSNAEGYASHAEGYASHAEGAYSHAEGYASHAEGDFSHAEGFGSYAEGYASHAEGHHSHAEGAYSHAEGSGMIMDIFISGGANATTYLVDSTTYLIVGASIRYTNFENGAPTYRTSKIVSIDVENSKITVSRTLSDTALSNCAVSVYVFGMALGDSSHAEGTGVIAAGGSQHAQGEYNVIDPEYDVNNGSVRGKYAHIVGNGTSYKSRSNAHTLDWAGNAWFAGGVKVGGIGQDDDDAKSVLLEGDAIPAPPTATVGQTIRVSAVDDNGVPTAWEVVDLPVGIPACTADDNGKILSVVDGVPAWVSVTGAEDASS